VKITKAELFVLKEAVRRGVRGYKDDLYEVNTIGIGDPYRIGNRISDAQLILSLVEKEWKIR
jgi:hypothetical protein